MSIDEMIAVLLAFKAGKKIQYRSLHSDDKWSDVTGCPWDFAQYEYRVKREPREVVGWIHQDVFGGDAATFYPNEDRPECYYPDFQVRAKLVEILEDTND